jgi:hypothetical protein
MNELIATEKIAQWEKLKGMVLDSVFPFSLYSLSLRGSSIGHGSSPITNRVYNMALNEFMVWFQQMPGPGFTKSTVSAWRVSLGGKGPPSLLECRRSASWRRRRQTTGCSRQNWRKGSAG